MESKSQIFDRIKELYKCEGCGALSIKPEMCCGKVMSKCRWTLRRLISRDSACYFVQEERLQEILLGM